ncbi:MAG: hypothetical protein H0X51_03985 [Parachlamydiaceae bacterium]|nr:hypothetical protein [Parachlamydiaceae bacterium]
MLPTRDLSIFLNTFPQIPVPIIRFRCDLTGCVANLSWRVGNFCLIPFRYLCNGEVATIALNVTTESSMGNFKKTIHLDYLAFSADLQETQKRTRSQSLVNGCIRLPLVALAIVMFLPGTVLGIVFKGIAYLLSSDARKLHELLVDGLATRNRDIPGSTLTIGSPKEPVHADRIQSELENAYRRDIDRIKTVVMHVFGNLNEDRVKDKVMDLSKFPLVTKVVLVGPHKETDIDFSKLAETLNINRFEMGSTKNTRRVRQYPTTVEGAQADCLRGAKKRFYVVLTDKMPHSVQDASKDRKLDLSNDDDFEPETDV